MAGVGVSPRPANDPTTPSLEDYKAAQKDVSDQFDHNLYLRSQTNNETEKQKGRDELNTRQAKVNAMERALRKSGKIK